MIGFPVDRPERLKIDSIVAPVVASWDSVVMRVAALAFMTHPSMSSTGAQALSFSSFVNLILIKF
jgi:hypothetical protein